MNNTHYYEDQAHFLCLQEMAFTLSQVNLILNLQNAVVN